MIRFRLLTALDSLKRRHISVGKAALKKKRHTWQLRGGNPSPKEQAISLHNQYLFAEIVQGKHPACTDGSGINKDKVGSASVM